MNQETGTFGGIKADKIIFIIFLVMMGISTYVTVQGSDIAEREILLYTSRMLLKGKQLYRDVFTVQQPLIAWLYVIPVYLARFIPLPDYKILSLIGLSVTGFSVFLCNRLLQSHPGFADNSRRRIQLGMLMLLTFILFYGPSSFFDREHIFMVMIFPYLFRWMPSLSRAVISRRSKIIIGFMAAVGYCIKPQCAILFMGVQLFQFIDKRLASILWSLENLVIYTFTALYIIAVFIFTPEYISIVLPMTLETYSGSSRRILGLIYCSEVIIILGIALIDFRWRVTSPYRKDIFYFLTLCILFLLYALTNNGWAYTYSPLLCAAIIVTGWIWVENLWLKKEAEMVNLPARSFVFGSRACAITLVSIFLFSTILDTLSLILPCVDISGCTPWIGYKVIPKMGNAKSFGTISGDFDLWPRISEETGMSWDTRFNHLWMMPKFWADGNGDDFQNKHLWIVQYVAQALADDMNIKKPDIMFVDDLEHFYTARKHVDMVAYFNEFPAFHDAWRHYHFVGSISRCENLVKVHCSVNLYRRIP